MEVPVVPDLSAGAAWLARRGPVARKRAGQWATPWWVVAAVARQACRPLSSRPCVVDPACGDGRWLIAAARERPGARLIGIDIDPEAIAAARTTLDAAGVTADLRVADALSPVPPWERADLVLGNPPWVRPQNLSREVCADLWSRFEAATDKADLYACFVERALDTATRVALVLPEGWLHLTSFAALRRRVLAAGIEGLWALPQGTFSEMPVPAVALVTGADDRHAGRVTADGLVGEGTVHVGGEAWSLAGPLPELPGTPLGDHATIHMGVVCGDYPRYVHRGRRFAEDRPTCRGRDVGRWAIAATDEHLRYVPRDMLDRKPYVAPKHAGLFDVPHKLVLAGTSGTEIRAAMDTERRFPLDSCYVVHARDPWAVLGLLLSGPVGDWYAARHRAPRVKAVEIRRIPVPRTGWAAIGEAARAMDDAAVDEAVRAAYARR